MIYRNDKNGIQGHMKNVHDGKLVPPKRNDEELIIYRFHTDPAKRALLDKISESGQAFARYWKPTSGKNVQAAMAKELGA